MTRHNDSRQMNGGWQMDLFPVEPEPAQTDPDQHQQHADPNGPDNEAETQPTPHTARQEAKA